MAQADAFRAQVVPVVLARLDLERHALGDLEASEYRVARAKDKFDAALAAYRSALENTTKGRLAPETLFRIGELLRWAGKHDDALKHYTRAVDQYPTSPVKPYARLGAAYASLGLKKPEEARAHAAAARDGRSGQGRDPRTHRDGSGAEGREARRVCRGRPD